ncbi:hypothetical protein FQN54_007854 [Arachnomyces sp. PD_36]|nr:hypothetical protein FQN54_007854 [Arachnomyces sp. PD_36]
MKLFVLIPLLTLQTSTVLAGASQDQDATDLSSLNNILARIEENSVPTTLFTWSNKLRDGIFSRDRHANGKRQSNGETDVTSPSDSQPSAVPTVVVPTEPPTTNPDPTDNPTPTEPGTDTGSENPPTDSPTDTPTDTPDQPTSPSSTSSKEPTTSSFQTQTKPSETSSSSTVSKTSESTTSSEQTTTTEETTASLTSKTTTSTTTLPDGTKSTITSVTVVNPTAEVTGSPTQTRDAPGLQTGAAAGAMVSNNELLALFGGAAAFAMVL